MFQLICKVEGWQVKMIYKYSEKCEIKIERKEIHGMTQNKMFSQVLEDIKKRRKSWQEKSKRKTVERKQRGRLFAYQSV
jgi:hypothetical protein